MYSLNRATILGNLTKDPELRYTPNGQAVSNFGVATNRRYKNSSTGEIVEDTQFHDVVAWGKVAEVINQIFRKGSKIYLEGRLQTRNWEAPDGSKRYRTEIIIENFVPLTPKGEMPTKPSSASPASAEKSPATAPPTNKKIIDKKDKDRPASAKQSTPSPSASAKPSANKNANKNKSDDEEFNLDDIPF